MVGRSNLGESYMYHGYCVISILAQVLAAYSRGMCTECLREKLHWSQRWTCSACRPQSGRRRAAGQKTTSFGTSTAVTTALGVTVRPGADRYTNHQVSWTASSCGPGYRSPPHCERCWRAMHSCRRHSGRP